MSVVTVVTRRAFLFLMLASFLVVIWLPIVDCSFPLESGCFFRSSQCLCQFFAIFDVVAVLPVLPRGIGRAFLEDRREEENAKVKSGRNVNARLEFHRCERNFLAGTNI